MTSRAAKSTSSQTPLGPMYQVDRSVTSSGKNLSKTKRRVTWKWGTANVAAIDEGAVGVDCRGSEHEISLVWSIASGKRYVLHDSEEVHYSTGKRGEGKIQVIWYKGPHVFTIFAHAASPIRSKPGFKQFDLLIDGRSFSDLPHIYQLGGQRVTFEKIAATPRKVVEKREARVIQGTSACIPPQDLISTPLPNTQPHLRLVSDTTTTTFQSMSSSEYEFSPFHPPSQDDVWHSILSNYDHGHDGKTVQSTEETQASSSDERQYSPVASLEVDTSSSEYVSYDETESPRDVMALEDAFRSLVNLEDIDRPVSHGHKLTMNPEKENNVRPSMHEKGLSLKEIKERHAKTMAPNREVMKSHHVNTAVSPNGQLVVYGQTQYNNYIPPPPLTNQFMFGSM